jgi:hypothetical protein
VAKQIAATGSEARTAMVGSLYHRAKSGTPMIKRRSGVIIS